jgi:hypothetical protein
MADRSRPGPSRLPRVQLPSRAALITADAVSLLAFVAVGMRSHRIGAIAEVAARNVVPLAVTWVLVSFVAGTYRRRDLVSLLATWVVAVPLGLLARTWWVGSPRGGRIAVFLGVAMVSTLVFLMIGRGVAAAITRTRPVWRARLSSDRRAAAGEPGHALPRSRGTG